MGVPVKDHQLTTFSFADDQVVVIQAAYDLEFMIKRLYKEWLLQVSLKKTQCLIKQ